MRVDAILRAKGSHVESVPPDTPVAVLVDRLTRLNIGALAISRDGERLEGLVGERDLVRGLAAHRGGLLDLRAADVMIRDVPVCRPEDDVATLMALMTRTRQRHVPVLEHGRLCGLVSIGDVVKHRLEELQLETRVLRDAYLAVH